MTIESLVLLALLDAVDEPVSGRTRLQKYTFLLQERADVDGYDFAAGDYGPFSRRFYSDVDELLGREWIEESKTEDDSGQIWYYYDAGDAPGLEALAGADVDVDELREVAVDIREEFDDRPLPELIEEIYASHPSMARNSVF